MKWCLSSEPLIFLYAIIFTINYTVLPQLVTQKLCLRHNDFNHTVCNQVESISDTIQKESAEWWFYLLTASLVPSVFTVLIWGPVTDTIGRKRAMVFVPLVNATRALVYLLNSYFLEAHVGYLLFGSFLSCFYGEFQGVVALCYAYMADLTTDRDDERTMRMAFIEAGVFYAGIPSGLLSAYLLQKVGYVSVFILTMCINACILLYVVCLLPKSSRNVRRGGSELTSKTPILTDTTFRESGDESDSSQYEQFERDGVTYAELLNPFHQLKQAFKVVTNERSRAVILPLIAAFGFTVCSVLGELIVQVLYLKNRPFLFDAEKIGYYSAVQAAIRGTGVILITQLSYHCFQFSDYSLIFGGLASQIACYVLIGVSRNTLAVYLVNLSGFAIPAATTSLRSLVTKHVSEENYGAVLGSLEAVDAIAGVLTNAISLWTYNLTLHIYTGVTYFGLAGFAAVAFVIVLCTYCKEELC